MDIEEPRIVRHNFIVNILDGGFFGLALGFASFVSVLPLFVRTMTDSAILIGLIPAVHTMGWQLPQLFVAQWVSRQARFKPMVLWMTIHERLPFLGMAFVAWFSPNLGAGMVLLLTFMMLSWQGFGGGFTGNAWQSMVGKIIPAKRTGTFFGLQNATMSLFVSLGAVLSGRLLEAFPSPLNYTLCFLCASVFLVVSFVFLAMTKETPHEPDEAAQAQAHWWHGLKRVLKNDIRFRWFMVVRVLMQLTTMAFAFYTIYAVDRFGMSPAMAGVMAGLLSGVQIAANLLMGWAGDRLSRRFMLGFGALVAALSALLAILAPNLEWFYLIFSLAGIANVALWTIILTMTLEFGGVADRPIYIGIANTLVAPATLLAPFLGGWLADSLGYSATFSVSILCGLLTAGVLFLVMTDVKTESLSVEGLPVGMERD